MTWEVAREARFKVVPDCVARDVMGEVVLLHLKTGTYFSMDRTGSIIWKLLETPKTVDEVSVAVAGHYGRRIADVEGDVREFVNDLIEHELVVIHEDAEV